MSQRELGNKIGLGKPAKLSTNSGSARINRYERGVHTISLDALGKIAEALEMPPAFFVAESDELADLALAMAGDESLVDASPHRGAPSDSSIEELAAQLQSLIHDYQHALRVVAKRSGRLPDTED